MSVRYGLIGRKLGHSFSPRIHREMGGYEYELMEMEPEEVGGFLRKGDFRGINVTIPYKQTVMPYLDEISEAARRIGSVNTIVKGADGRLRGTNTDYGGFRGMLERAGLSPKGEKCLVLGSGGASRTAVTCLKDMGAREVRVISRSGEDNYGNLERHRDAGLLVNATPVGMYPKNGEAPLDLGALPGLKGIADMIYNPARTALLLEAERRGIRAINGLYMLVEQAREACELFLGREIDRGETERVTALLAAETENIVLIGMPGCGKTTVGRLLAEKTGRELVDTDGMIEEKAGRACGEIIREDGEESFRRMETEAVREAGKRSGVIIATGGGVVTREENRDLLRQNGVLFHLERPLDEETLEPGRPLSDSREKWERLARERGPLYAAWRDARVENLRAEEAAEEILDRLDAFVKREIAFPWGNQGKGWGGSGE